MDNLVVVLVLISTHIIVLSIGFLVGARIGEWRANRRAERQSTVSDTHRRNGKSH